MKIWIIGSVVLLLLLYAMGGRAWLKTKPWAAGFFALVEPIEIALYKKSETILFARIKMVTGILLTIMAQLQVFDITPLMPFVSENYQGLVKAAFNALPLAITVIGMVDEKLRNQTTLPIQIVAVPDKVIAETPKVAEAIAAKTEAVEALQTKAA